MLPPLRQVQLEGKYVTLVPLNMSHAQALADVANVSRDSYNLTSVPHDLETAKAYIHRALELYKNRTALPFAIVETLVGKVVGTTRFMNIEFWEYPDEHYLKREYYTPHVVEIGATWLGAAYQRTGINTDAKICMLKYAFEEWHALRVQFKTDARNVRSRANIERVGARFDGIIRSHMPSYDGGVRDSAFYSITYAEWPDVKKRLEAKLG
jgi:RimJ/RimL family protein N-acetyltransferase